ncbi:6,7-dimethyl-8-ribityllumazine synthase [Candidatus Foliamicus sp.]
MVLETASLKVLLVAADYYDELTARLEQGAREAFMAGGISERRIVMRRVPGCWELPLATQRLIRRHSPDAAVALGVLIRGETDHYAHIARECCAGLMRVGLEEGIAIGLGVLTCDSFSQAEARCSLSSGKQNKGAEAARAVLRMLSADS